MDQKIVWVTLKWGFIPSWAKEEKIGYKMINARAESLAEKPSFRKAFQTKRCLIIADSYYEWKNTEERKVPMRIKLKSDKPFAMAGIWETWKSANGVKIYSCAIITTQANAYTASVHERMPVILKPEDEKIWLDPSIQDSSYLNDLLKPFDAHLMEAFEVSNEVNTPKNNAPHLIQSIC